MSKAIVSITVPAELVAQLDARAESEYRSRSSLATQLIARGLAERNEGQVEPGLSRNSQQESV